MTLFHTIYFIDGVAVSTCFYAKDFVDAERLTQLRNIGEFNK